MNKTIFEIYETEGSLKLCGGKEIQFADIPWSNHPTFEGVALKHLVTGKDTNGEFSYHLVRIAPNKSIGEHIHAKQLETHEIIAGNGTCINNGTTITYQPGVVSILPLGTPHEVHAGNEGLYIFAKFMPALN